MLDTGVLNATVPTQEMRQGNFCNVATGEGILYNGQPAKVPTLPGGGCQMPASLIDPGMQSLMNLYPLPNTSGNGFNYAQSEIFNQNNQQWVARADYNVSDNTKIFVRYNLQRETQPFPVGLWWRQTQSGSLPDLGRREESVRLGYWNAHARIQPHHDKRGGFRLHVYRLPERVCGPCEGEPEQCWI